MKWNNYPVQKLQIKDKFLKELIESFIKINQK